MNLKETQKLIYLERILKLYVQFLKAYSEVNIEVISKTEGLLLDTKKELDRYGNPVTRNVTIASYFDPTLFVRITYYNPKINIYEFQAIEFPMDDLSKRIDHYKRKLMTAFKNRHK